MQEKTPKIKKKKIHNKLTTKHLQQKIKKKKKQPPLMLCMILPTQNTSLRVKDF